MPMDDLAIMISCPNNPAELERLVGSIHRIVRDFRLPATVHLVDDGRQPEQAHTARALGVPVVAQRGEGYGALIKAAAEGTTCRYLITLDGDGLHPPELLPHLFAGRDRADVVIASRYVPQGFTQMPWWRELGSRAMNRTFRRLLGLPFHDLSSSYRLYRRDLLDRVFPVMSTDAALQEILIKSYCEGYSIAEVPMHYLATRRRRGRGVSRLVRLGADYVRTFTAMWKLRNSIDSADYDTRAFFSRIPFQRWWQRRRYAIVSDYVGDRARVLDAGCGSTQLLNRFPQAIGMDYSRRKLRFMRRPGRRLVNGSTRHLPFRSGAFDVVISSQVIEHLPADPRIFEELDRCLRPGGTLVLGTVDYGRWQWPLIERLYAVFKPTGYAHEHITHYTHRNLTDIIRGLGMSVEGSRYICGGEVIFKARKPLIPDAVSGFSTQPNPSALIHTR